jgi:uncharacterized membrane protein
MHKSILRLIRSLSTVGLVVGSLFFAASLTPSLIPRDFVLQGVLSGGSLAIGYLLGILVDLLWRFLQLPVPSAKFRTMLMTATLAASALVIVLSLRQASIWQDSIRVLMELAPVERGRPFETGIVAALVFAVLLALARLVRWIFLALSERLARRLPSRIAIVGGLVVVAVLLMMAVNGLLFKVGLRVADSSFRALDEMLVPDVARPEDPLKTGSPASLVDWEGIGRMGRAFVASGPDASAIGAFTGRAAMEPLRVYVGLNSADTVEERAVLALEEMKRVGAFERSVLVVVTPTGTGWVDPSAADTLEYLHHGDVASVAIQYSYLASWLSLLVEPGYGAEASRALFNAVYGHWISLPRDARPRLYLNGLSLGSLNSDLSMDIYAIVGDPIQGALWTGPPFPSRTWRVATNGRDAGSPAWLPRFRDGSIIRFANQHGGASEAEAPWGPIRIVYLQYASDSITFFEPEAAFREPQWMQQPRGPDVSPALRWFPVVTLLQLGIDIILATEAPMGYGHVYAPEHHIDPWIEVTQPPGWSTAEVERLKSYFRAQRDAQPAVVGEGFDG